MVCVPLWVLACKTYEILVCEPCESCLAGVQAKLNILHYGWDFDTKGREKGQEKKIYIGS